MSCKPIFISAKYSFGGIFLFLCSNLGNGPAGDPGMPQRRSGTVSGTLTPASPGWRPGTTHSPPAIFPSVPAALESETAYGNIHTTKKSAGEIRGEVRKGGSAGRVKASPDLIPRSEVYDWERRLGLRVPTAPNCPNFPTRVLSRGLKSVATVAHCGWVPKLAPHILRHSFASIGLAGGNALAVIGALLGHADAQTTLRYAHLTE